MGVESWTIFALFWLVFVTTPGPNAANCIQNGMAFGFVRALWGVLGILTQATLFLFLSALGVTALIATSPTAFLIGKLAGAGLLIGMGLRNWQRAQTPIRADAHPSRQIYARALAIATLNPKSIAGYLAAFSQFVMPDTPISQQMWVIVPTALSLTTLSYLTYTALGAWLGRQALSALANTLIRRILAVCFILYGLLLGAVAMPQ